jgi:hypothetical protein
LQQRLFGDPVAVKYTRVIFAVSSNPRLALSFLGPRMAVRTREDLLQHTVEKVIKAAGFSVNEQIANTLLPSSEQLRELCEEFSPMAR